MTHNMTRQEFLEFVKPGMALILRGAPGAGKSTLVEGLDRATTMPSYNSATNLEDVHVASADLHRYVDGVYTFDPSKNDEAHAGCLRDFIDFAQTKLTHKSVIVCDNTNTSPTDMAPYTAVARAYGWKPVVVTVLTDPEVAAARNVHGVPANRVYDMYDRVKRTMGHVPSRWTQITVEGA